MVLLRATIAIVTILSACTPSVVAAQNTMTEADDASERPRLAPGARLWRGPDSMRLDPLACARLGSTSTATTTSPREVARHDERIALCDASHRHDALSLAASAPATSEARFKERLAPARQQRTAGRRILGAIVGATAGFFAGGYTGAWIEGDGCHCDDPGLKGALIGAPIGAAAGGVLGALYLF